MQTSVSVQFTLKCVDSSIKALLGVGAHTIWTVVHWLRIKTFAFKSRVVATNTLLFLWLSPILLQLLFLFSSFLTNMLFPFGEKSSLFSHVSRLCPSPLSSGFQILARPSSESQVHCLMFGVFNPAFYFFQLSSWFVIWDEGLDKGLLSRDLYLSYQSRYQNILW